MSQLGVARQVKSLLSRILLLVVPQSEEHDSQGQSVRDVLLPRLRYASSQDDTVWEVDLAELIACIDEKEP